jgi:hypothetical protein
MTLEDIASIITTDETKQSILVEAAFGGILSVILLLFDALGALIEAKVQLPLLSQTFLSLVQSFLFFCVFSQLALALIKILFKIAEYLSSKMQNDRICLIF